MGFPFQGTWFAWLLLRVLVRRPLQQNTALLEHRAQSRSTADRHFFSTPVIPPGPCLLVYTGGRRSYCCPYHRLCPGIGSGFFVWLRIAISRASSSARSSSCFPSRYLDQGTFRLFKRSRQS